MYSPRGIFRLWPVRSAAASKVAAPMLEPAKRPVQGDNSCSATAAAIQLKPQAKANSTTSSLAVAATLVLALRFGTVVVSEVENVAHAIAGAPGWRGIPALQIRSRLRAYR